VKIALTAGREASAAAPDIASLLRERLRAATRRNPRFSLRSLARKLGINHSTLSQVLRGKRRLSPRALEIVGKRMGLADETIRACAANVKKRPNAKNRPENILRVHLDLDTFQLLSAWHHYAILELIHLRDFKTDSRWIANTLGIAVEDVNIALQRLLRLGLLEMAARDRWIDKSGDAEFDSVDLTEQASNLISQELLELTSDAITRIPGQHRIHRQMVLAVDSTKLPQLQTLADDFMQDLRTLVSESDAKDDVYQVAIALFPVTTLKKTRGEKKCPTPSCTGRS
jgi:uncharacterized protein (TIGR02147 family)